MSELRKLTEDNAANAEANGPSSPRVRGGGDGEDLGITRFGNRTASRAKRTDYEVAKDNKGAQLSKQ